MSSQEMLARALDVRQVLQDTPYYYSVGLCRLIPYGCADREQFQALLLKWPENVEQSSAFPVPAPKGYIPKCAYTFDFPRIDAFDNLPKYTGEYGAARLRLLDFIIVELEKENG